MKNDIFDLFDKQLPKKNKKRTRSAMDFFNFPTATRPTNKLDVKTPFKKMSDWTDISFAHLGKITPKKQTKGISLMDIGFPKAKIAKIKSTKSLDIFKPMPLKKKLDPEIEKYFKLY